MRSYEMSRWSDAIRRRSMLLALLLGMGALPVLGCDVWDSLCIVNCDDDDDFDFDDIDDEIEDEFDDEFGD